MPKMKVDLHTRACHNSTCNQSDTIVGKIPIRDQCESLPPYDSNLRN